MTTATHTIAGLPLRLVSPTPFMGYTGIEAEKAREVAGRALACLAAAIVATGISFVLSATLAVPVITGVVSAAAGIAIVIISKRKRDAFRQKEHPPSNLKIIEVESFRGEPPKMDLEPEELYRLDPDKVRRFEAACGISHRGVWDSSLGPLFNAVEVLTLQELKQGVKSCAERVNELIGDGMYAVGTVPGKSSHWIAQYAVKFMKNLPSYQFNHATDSCSLYRREHDVTTTGVENFIVFDDACYSGNQMATIIRSISDDVLASKNEYHLYFVYPFTSNVALEVLGKMNFPANLKVTFITTKHRIRSVADVLPEEAHNSVFSDGRKPKHLAVTEWKIPDGASFPTIMTAFHEDRNCFCFHANKKKPLSVFAPDRAAQPVYRRQK